MLAMPLAAALARAVASAGPELSTASTLSHLARQVQGEAAGGGEAIERLAAARVAGGGAVVLALIEEDAGLLPVQQVGPQGEAVHLHRHGLGNFAGEHGGFERQLLLGAHRDIVARHDPLGVEDLLQAGRDLVLGGVHALVEGLHDQVVAVAVHHQRGQQVGFAVHHAVGVGMADHSAAVCLGGAQAAQKEIAADLFDLPRQHAQSDLRSWSCSAPCRADGPADRRP